VDGAQLMDLVDHPRKRRQGREGSDRIMAGQNHEFERLTSMRTPSGKNMEAKRWNREARKLL